MVPNFKYFKKAINIATTEEYVLVDDNNEDYEDIYLCSLCNAQVASQGSWGRMAYTFNDNSNKKMIIPIVDDKDMSDYEGVAEKILTKEMFLQD